MNKKTAIIDFDGTLTRVRCGWDKKMKEFFLDKIFAEPANFNETQKQEALRQTDAWIERAPGTTIFQQMSALSEILSTHQIAHQLDELIEEFDTFSSDWEYARVKELESKGELEQLMLCGARKFLDDLSDLGYELHLLSGTSHDKLIFECDTLGISRYFTHIQGYQSHLASPYKLESMRKTILDYEYKASHTLIIGDGLTELEAGRELNCPCLGVAICEEDGKSCDHEKLGKLQERGFEQVITNFDKAIALLL
ncbi:HAD hydrolase-like protein [Lentisphaera marina]|uniref:HAD family hydrolase n=1 Tax=Lentisphaera marina TaxID=1111041 RepID=UPI0023654BC4|nr:HAD family hydrolase [Lentisphaera marina]MDD7986930.1 HAD hydrolase-like protein [Lentisphaera marina]